MDRRGNSRSSCSSSVVGQFASPISGSSGDRSINARTTEEDEGDGNDDIYEPNQRTRPKDCNEDDGYARDSDDEETDPNRIFHDIMEHVPNTEDTPIKARDRIIRRIIQLLTQKDLKINVELKRLSAVLRLIMECVNFINSKSFLYYK